MLRNARLFMLVGIVVLAAIIATASAQSPASAQPVDPVTTEEPSQPAAPFVPLQTEQQSAFTDWGLIVSNVRSDMELLATATLGTNRPDGWNGSLDASDPQFALIARLDLEELAGTLMGAESRPAGWFGVVGSTPDAIARDLRHDLELLADSVLDPALGRPIGWVGGPPLMRCDRATQALVNLLEANGTFNLQADRTAADFCAQAALEVSVYVETQLLATPATVTDEGFIVPGSASIDSEFGVAFLDRGAIYRAGVFPNGTAFEPVGRSPAEFSKMMLVRGNGFVVFVDRNFTTITSEQFAALPIADDMTETFCTADWCDQP